jgi:hypothetical protein
VGISEKLRFSVNYYEFGGWLSYLNSTTTLLFEEYILRLHVTVNDLVAVKQVQALE